MHSGATARTQPAAAAPADAWPARDPAVAERLRERTPTLITSYEWTEGAAPAHVADSERTRLLGVEAEVLDCRSSANGLLRIYRMPEPEADEVTRGFAALLGDFHPNGSFVSSYYLSAPTFQDWLASERQTRAAMALPPGAAPGSLHRSNLSAEIALEGGVEFQLPEPGASGRRGLILHYSALITNEYEKRFLDQLRERGWAVIDFGTWSGVRAPRDPKAVTRLPDLEARRRSLQQRIHERTVAALTQAELDPILQELDTTSSEASRIRRGWFTACAPDDAENVGEAIANAADDAFAENAYAAEAVLDYINARRPDIPTSPLVVIGFSAGALASPAVAVRLGPRVDAVVIVGGGADLMTISRTTTQRGAAIKVLCDEQPVDDALYAAIDAAYLRHTRLDPYALSPLLTHTPILMVHANDDITVPAATGETLYERLGRPDRLNFAGDHFKLFYFIPGQAGRVAEWLDRQVSTAR